VVVASWSTPRVASAVVSLSRNSHLRARSMQLEDIPPGPTGPVGSSYLGSSLFSQRASSQACAWSLQLTGSRETLLSQARHSPTSRVLPATSRSTDPATTASSSTGSPAILRTSRAPPSASPSTTTTGSGVSATPLLSGSSHSEAGQTSCLRRSSRSMSSASVSSD